MALADILRAITEEANAQLAELQKEWHQEALDRTAMEQKELKDIKQSIATQKEQKMHFLRMKTEGHAKMHTRHALLAKKQEMITEVYAEVATALCALPSKEMEALLSLCLKSSHVTEGVIRPAKGQEKHFEKLLEKGFILGNSIESKGGFLLETPQKDFNFTFESLIFDLLKPSTEISTASSLFSA